MTLGELFIRALKWFLFISLIIGGIAAMIAVEEGDVKPMMLAVFSFGGAYLMSNSWRDMPAKAMILSILWAAFSALLASRLPNMAYNMAGIIIPYHFFYIWIGLSFFPGVPIMMFIFKKYGE